MYIAQFLFVVFAVIDDTNSNRNVRINGNQYIVAVTVDLLMNIFFVFFFFLVANDN